MVVITLLVTKWGGVGGVVLNELMGGTESSVGVLFGDSVALSAFVGGDVKSASVPCGLGYNDGVSVGTTFTGDCDG